MSTSTSQSGDVIIEVKTEAIGPEVKKEESEIEDENIKSNREHPNKYLAVSPEGDFLVELVLKDFDFELQMYDIKISNDKVDSKQKSGRELSKIHTTFKFTNGQINLSKDKNVHKNILECLKDMEYYKENFDNIHPTQIPNHGFTFVFIINIINNVYSISDFKDKELPIKYGGVVKLISKKNDIINQNGEKNDKQRTDKSSQNADIYTFIILTLSGIYKYQMKNKLIKNIQKLKYPRRVYNAMILNTTFFDSSNDSVYYTYNNVHTDIKQCLNKHYFLADTMNEDIKYIELYDLNTNHLVNIFQRRNLSGLYDFDFPSDYAISNNGKLLAYFSLFNRAVKIFSLENGLEIAELITDIASIDIEIIDFFRNDETLLVLSKNKWFVWDIFGSLLGSFKPMDIDILELPSSLNKNIERSNSFMVVNKGDEPSIYDDLIVNIYLKDLKKDEEQNWKKFSSDDFSKQDTNTNNIRDLQNKETKLDEYYHILEPWLIDENRRHSRYSFYLDEKKEKLLLIGHHTIQVWHDQGPEKGPKKRSLEFIYVPLPFNHKQDIREEYTSEQLYMIKVIDINYCIGKFKLNIQIDDKKFSNKNGR
ncbi:transient receptor potential cation channel subfamily a member 1-like isoform x1 [Gigaspora margarita]|uniref:Transient receptor potential cation channel subfamily a member 1-like isoform x1 n=1 Tax=Gigaspora margarita TaxID=4874 RepID=A0A8H4AT60_GIGMA|nr:transient receptor potential cation channel subfamily a member 1-like isoform x1 [Gigaspora margarita]